MRPSQIAQIIIRLFAVVWFVSSVVQIILVFVVNRSGMSDPLAWAPTIVTFLFALAVWFAAPTLGRLIAGKNDPQETVTGVTFGQLLHAMFIGLGLYFCLGSFASLLSNAYFMVVLAEAHPEEMIKIGMNVSTHHLVKDLLTFAAGVFVIWTAPHWVRKICNTQELR